jgi:hypothetical protein
MGVHGGKFSYPVKSQPQNFNIHIRAIFFHIRPRISVEIKKNLKFSKYVKTHGYIRGFDVHIRIRSYPWTPSKIHICIRGYP